MTTWSWQVIILNNLALLPFSLGDFFLKLDYFYGKYGTNDYLELVSSHFEKLRFSTLQSFLLAYYLGVQTVLFPYNCFSYFITMSLCY